MLASFSIVPVGQGDALAEPVAEMIRIVERSGLPYRLGPMETTVEGELEQVLDLILSCHRRMRELHPRVHTSIAIDDREGATGRLTGKVAEVEELLRKRGQR